MKMSILLGVAQMNLGIILSYFNAWFFNNSLDIRCGLWLHIMSALSSMYALSSKYTEIIFGS